MPNNAHSLSENEIIEIGRAADAAAAFVRDVSRRHRRPNVTVAQEFLHGADVASGFDEVSREGMAQRMGRDSL